jgi:hypothetical protein
MEQLRVAINNKQDASLCTEIRFNLDINLNSVNNACTRAPRSSPLVFLQGREDDKRLDGLGDAGARHLDWQEGRGRGRGRVEGASWGRPGEGGRVVRCAIGGK